jgi:SAM-dependent methyltransferase
VDQDDLFERAVDPRQYDRPDLAWVAQGGERREAHIWEYVAPLAETWCGRRIIDIGSGTGWLVARAASAGAAHVVGVEPSAELVAVARNRYPAYEFHEAALEDFEADEAFDVALLVMVLSHFRSPDTAFRAVRRLLTPTGEIQVLMDVYSAGPRKWEKQRVDLGPDEAVILLDHPLGALADVLRSGSSYVEAAVRERLAVIQRVPLFTDGSDTPTYERIRFAPVPG